MRIMKSVFAGVLFLLLAMAVPAFAQEQQEEAKPENPKTEAKPAQPDRATPAQKKDEARPAQEPQRQGEQRRTEEQQQEHRQQDADRAQDQQQKQQREHSGDMRNDERRDQQQAAHRNNDRSGSGRPHARIPDDRFRASFGREHHFRIEQRPVIVEGAPRFQYGGYWFELAQPWPTDWIYTDDFFIDDIDGDYYMYDPRFPSVRILVYVIEL